MAAAQRRCAAQTLQLSRLLFAGAFGLLQSAPLAHRPASSRSLPAAAVHPAQRRCGRTARSAGLCRGSSTQNPGTGPVRQAALHSQPWPMHRCIPAAPVHTAVRADPPIRVLHHQQSSGALLCILRQQLCAGLFQCFASVRRPAPECWQGSAPARCAAPVHGSARPVVWFLFLIHSDRSYGTFYLKMISKNHTIYSIPNPA